MTNVWIGSRGRGDDCGFRRGGQKEAQRAVGQEMEDLRGPEDQRNLNSETLKQHSQRFVKKCYREPKQEQIGPETMRVSEERSEKLRRKRRVTELWVR